MIRTGIYLRILAGLSCLVLIGLGCSSQQNAGSKTASQDSTLVSLPPPADSLKIELVGMDSLSVFELLERTHKVSYHPTALGVFVTGIDSVKNDARHFWVYSVNDSLPQIASDKYVTATGDRIVWHYRKIE